MENRVDISVVVAAYNEESVIIQNLQRIVTTLESREEITWEIICVNDGSYDRTGMLLDEFAQNDNRVKVIHHPRNFGQGRALRTAFNICRGDVIVTLDADLSYHPKYIFELKDALQTNNVEIALASPYKQGGEVQNVPFYRYLLSKLANYYLARMSPYSISTSTSVARAYRREVLDSLILNSDGMELLVEILLKAYALGFKICEIPAQLRWDKEKNSNAKLHRVSKMRILRTAQTYLFLGWLTRPAAIFLPMSWFLMLLGLYMFSTLIYRILEMFSSFRLNMGWRDALSLSLREAFNAYTYSFVIYGGVFLVGLQIFTYVLTLLQNKYYHTELLSLANELKKIHAMLKNMRKEE